MAAKPIVAGTDGSEESLRAVDWAAREAALRGAPLRIVSAAALLPRMAARVGTVEYDNVTDVLLEERDRFLAAAAERAARTAPGAPRAKGKKVPGLGTGRRYPTVHRPSLPGTKSPRPGPKDPTWARSAPGRL